MMFENKKMKKQRKAANEDIQTGVYNIYRN